jgi:hypothetical protein
MRGESIRVLQRALTNGKFGNFKPGKVDGEFGESTAGGVHRAKWWLGYPIQEYKHERKGWSCGDRLIAYLNGTKKLPPTYAARRKARLKRAGSKPLRLRMLAQAKTQVGINESPPGSNKVKYTAWYGMVGAWCAMFVTWCAVRSRSKAFVKGSRYAYTPFMVRDARLGVNRLSLVPTADVKPGHIVMFDWEGGGRSGNPYSTDHTGLFDEWITKGSTFKTIEGNTSSRSDSDGGAVERRDRSIGSVSAFIQAE